MRNCASVRLFLGGLLAAGVLAVLAVPGLSEEKVGNREQQINDLEKQIQDLNKKLIALRHDNGGAAAVASATPPTLAPDWIKPLTWRSIGPASMGGRITALSVFGADPSTYYVATASGGLLKTVNNGITFEHLFDRESTVSIGDVCVAPSDRNIVWVGTGENNPRNSVSYGDGVYKSTDGGKTWKNMGLKKSFQIGRIAIHPKDPNIVYVGALGRLYGPNEERGLFKTTNGGANWEKILFVDDKTGIIDMQMNPAEPNTLLVAAYERQRDLYDTNDPSKKNGPGSGLYKTTDGGKTFKKLTKGLPTCNLGRMGIDYYRKNPNTIYLVLESEKIGMAPPKIAALGIEGNNAPQAGGAHVTRVTTGSAAEKAALKVDDVIVAAGDQPIRTYDNLRKQLTTKNPGDKLKMKVVRDSKPVEVEVVLGSRAPAVQGPGGRQGGQGPQGPRGGMTVYIGFMGEFVEDAGIRVARLIEGGPAEKAGIKEGDMISAVAGKPLKAYADLTERIRNLKPGDKVKVTVDQGGKGKEVELTLAAPPANPFGGGRGGADPKRPFADSLGGQGPEAQYEQGPEGFQYGGVYKSIDGGESWTRLSSVNPRPMYFSLIRVDPSDENYIYLLGISLYRSSDGGETFKAESGRGVHPDQHALWIDPRDGRHMVIGCDGGFYVTYDRMAHWDHLNHLAIGQFYHVALDSRARYNVYGGLQDNGSWGGPSQTHTFTGPINEDWFMVGSGDGFVCRVDPNDADQVYYESQNGGMGRRNLRTGETGSIRPRAPQGQRFRFNWNTPFILSSHNSKIYYCAGNFVFRSLDRGNDLRVISPEITRTNKGSATALAESPRNPNVLYVGTDDGDLWVTKDGGREWTNITPNVGLAGPRCVATIEPSRFSDGRAYVAFDGHRSDDDNPLAFVTEDYGKTWKSLRANLPWGSTRCLREDIKNHNLLYLGTEFAVWVSLDRGESWTKLNNNLPTVAVHEIAIHPTAGEIVAATHGRSLWVLDVTALRQMTPDLVKTKAHLYAPSAAARWRPEPSRGGTSRRFVGQNPPTEAQIYYSLGAKPEKIGLKVMDYTGKTIRELKTDTTPGLHRVAWDLRLAPTQRGGAGGETAGGPGGGQGGRRGGRGTRQGGGSAAPAAGTRPASAPPAATSPEDPRPGGPGAAAPGGEPPARADMPTGGRPGGFGRGFGGPPVPPGMYRIVLTVDGQDFSQSLRVDGDVSGPSPIIAGEDDEDGQEPADGSW